MDATALLERESRILDSVLRRMEEAGRGRGVGAARRIQGLALVLFPALQRHAGIEAAALSAAGEEDPAALRCAAREHRLLKSLCREFAERAERAAERELCELAGSYAAELRRHLDIQRPALQSLLGGADTRRLAAHIRAMEREQREREFLLEEYLDYA